jgi:hypothetical protein
MSTYDHLNKYSQDGGQEAPGDFSRWAAHNGELAQNLTAWDFDTSDPAYPRNTFLARMGRLVKAGQPLSTAQTMAAAKAFTHWHGQLVQGTRPDPDAQPEWATPDLWAMTLLFEATGHGYGHRSNGRPRIYALLERAVRNEGWLDAPVWNEPSNHDPSVVKWVWVVREMIRYWWDYEMDPARPGSAIYDFTDPVEFAAMRDEIRARLFSEYCWEEFAKFDRGEPSGVVDCGFKMSPPEVRARHAAMPRARGRTWPVGS